LGPIQLSNPVVPVYIPLIRATRIVLSNPIFNIPTLFSFLTRKISQFGVWNLLTKKVKPMTFAMHNFMDADDVKIAHELNKEDRWSPDAKIKETQERLRACSYAFGHPETGEMIPGCVQHGVLDPEMNIKLKAQLPLNGAACCGSDDLAW
jgi:hypothetical protein